jgi:hypothetical protein
MYSFIDYSLHNNLFSYCSLCVVCVDFVVEVPGLVRVVSDTLSVDVSFLALPATSCNEGKFVTSVVLFLNFFT